MEMQFISEDEVKSLLDWGECFEAISQAFLAVVPYTNAPKANISPRSFTRAGKGVMLTMPGYIENYPLPGTGDQKHSTLACKLVTSFPGNHKLEKPLPSILATILLFDPETGKLKSIIEGTEITTWRTAATSLVATKHIFLDRFENSEQKFVLSIVGCGNQGRIHSKAMLSFFAGRFSEVRLWNRTLSKAESLSDELKELFPSIDIKVADTVKEGVKNADIIITTTDTSSPLIQLEDIKADCYINAIGAGLTTHHSELSSSIYEQAKVYIESRASATIELKGIESRIVAEVGEIINGSKTVEPGITIFQSLGSALEDAVVAALISNKFEKKTRPN